MAGIYGQSRQALDAADPVQVSPGRARELLGNLAGHTYQTFDNVFYGIDTTGAVARAGLYESITGKKAPDPMGGWGSRITGARLLEEAGLAPRRTKTWWGAALKGAAGIGVEMVTDPLSMLSGPTRALTSAGRAAEAAGLGRLAQQAVSSGDDVLDAAARYAAGSRDAGAELTSAGRAAAKAIDAAGLPITKATVAARPLVGPRVAYRRASLNQLLDQIDYAPKRQAAVDSINTFLKREGTTLAQVGDDPLARTLGIGLPLGDAKVSFDILGEKGGDLLAGAMDAVTERARWSAPGRLIGAVTNKATNGTFGMPDQIQAIRSNQLKAEGLERAGQRTGPMLAKAMLADLPPGLLPNGARSIFSEEGNKSILRLMELDKAKGMYDAADDALFNSAPAVQELVTNWDKWRREYIGRSRKWGLDSHSLVDDNGYLYVPRTHDEFQMLDGMKAAAGYDYSTMTADQLARTKEFKVPGGTQQLRELSIDPNVAGPNRAKKTDAEAAQYINDLFASKFPNQTYKPEYAVKLARALRNVPEANVAAKHPMFGSHPIESIAQYISGREKAIGAAKAQIEALADAAVHAATKQPTAVNFLGMEGGGHIAALDAAHAVGLKTQMTKNVVTGGAGMRLREAIAQRLKKDWRDIDLNDFSVPQNLIERLNRTIDTYKSPEAQTLIAEAFDQLTKVWKAGVLTWPARWVRDFYSGFVSNYLETGDLGGTLRSTAAARHLIAGRYDKFGSYLATLPKYAGQNADVALEHFLADMSASGIYSSAIAQDIRTANRTGQTALESIPGAVPLSPTGAIKELGYDSNREWMDWARMKGVYGATETKNPWFKMGEHASEFTDSLNRMTGMLTLMQQGIDPMAAAARIKRAQVDYGSLTTMERGLFSKVLFPFWAYQSRMGAYVVSKVLERPGGRYGQMMRVLHDAQNYDEDRYVPTSIREQFGFRLSGDERGDTYLTDIDLPGVDLWNVVKPGGTSPIDFQRTFASIAQMGNPIARAVAEHATGTNFFYKEPLHQVETGLDRLLQAGGLPKAHPLFNTAVSLFPMGSRADSLLRNIMAPNRTPLEKALDISVNTFTGVKRRHVGIDAELRDATEKIKDELRGSGREIPRWFVPQEDLQNLPQDKQEFYELYRMMDKYIREKGQARKEGRPLPRLPF